jgi:hypothetical protein
MDGSAKPVLEPYINPCMLRIFPPLHWHSLSSLDNNGSGNEDAGKQLSDKTKLKTILFF